MLITRNSIRDYVYLFRWISLSSLVFSTSSLSFPRPFLFFTKELPRISGRRLVSNSFINPLALFRISFSPPPPSFSFFLLYLFLSLSLYLRHQVPEDSAGRNIIHENLSPSLSISFPILLPPSLLPRSKFSSSRERSRHFLLLSSSHVSSMVSRVNIDRPRRCYCCYYRCCCCYP